MRPNGTLVGTRWGPISAIRPQPRRHREDELWVGTPTAPWGSRRLPRTLLADGPRRTTFRELLRCAEGVHVTFPDGSEGIVDEVMFAPTGYDFWPVALVVATAGGARRVPAADIRRIDVREPRLWAGSAPEPSLEVGRRRPAARPARAGLDRFRRGPQAGRSRRRSRRRPSRQPTEE